MLGGSFIIAALVLLTLAPGRVITEADVPS
jgi:hypothetical protein